MLRFGGCVSGREVGIGVIETENHFLSDSKPH